MNFMKQILPNQKVRQYVLKHFATCLSGYTRSEKFHIWTGSGGNGKSKLIELFEDIMGDYATGLPVTLITQKRKNNGAPDPSLATTQGVRFCSIQEPGDKAEINVGIMKELTGGDKIKARELYKMPIEFKPQFKLVLCCNKLPKLPPDDGGTWRRVRVIHFGSRFVDNPNPDNKNVKLGKAGRNRLLGCRPKVRGVVMNPVDHPHGGGEGRTSGGRHPVTPWGKSTKGKKTRNNKKTNAFILKRRKK